SASEDGEALNTPVFFDEDASTKELQASLDKLEEIINEKIGRDVTEGELDEEGLHVRFSGPVGIQTDTPALFGKSDITLLITTCLIVINLLIIIYQTPIIAIVPLQAV